MRNDIQEKYVVDLAILPLTVKRDGISLREMNKILLQKVKELTLYMLQTADHAKKQYEAILELKTALKEIKK